ncbi:MAG: class I SAM-dependent methyltransferase [Verrucomicrobiales bacterium]
MELISLHRPEVFVELGTHSGVSYCAFCQRIKELNLKTKCFAVDTWEGDPQAGLYGDSILADLAEFHNSRFSEFSQLLRMPFDQAVKMVEDKSVDLLHIDGFHSYDAVRYDFETWVPKLSNKAVVLFHDTNEWRKGFGVWKFWAEIRQKYLCFEFRHGHGLGVALIGQGVSDQIKALANRECELQEEFYTRNSELLLSRGLKLDEMELMQDAINYLQNELKRFNDSTKAKFEESKEKTRVLKEKIKNLKSKLAVCRSKNLEIESSLAWRLTKPLRWFQGNRFYKP